MGSWAEYSRDEKYRKIVRDMKQKSYDFGCFYQDYYQDKCDEEALTKVATQAYWQSLRLNKKRLDENGIQMRVNIKDKDKTVIDVKDFEDNGKTMVGTFKRNVIMDKSFVKDGKKLFRKKERRLCLSNVIQASGEGEQVACPNCGNLGKISSYIDGCDYCNSKFAVEEFEEKISSFHLEEDTGRKTRVLTGQILWSTFVALAIMVLALIGAFIYVIYSDVNHISNDAGYYFNIIGVFVIDLIPKVFRLLIISIVVFVVFAFVYMKRNYSRTKDNDITRRLQQVIPGFVPERFAQDIEYKLRNIHFADHAREVNAFANIDLAPAVDNYKDVIECVLEKMEFMNLEETVKGLFVTVQVDLILSRLKDGKIREANEKLFLVMSSRWDMKSALADSVSMYCCNTCGASVSLLEGGRCAYCGEKLDYGKYSWMIENYYSNVSSQEATQCPQKIYMGTRIYRNQFKKVKRQLAALYFGIFLIGMVSYVISNRENFYHALHYNQYISKYEEACNQLERLDGFSSQTMEELNYYYNAFSRRYVYDFESADVEIILEYFDYLETEGYKQVRSDRTTNVYSKQMWLTSDYMVYHIIRFETDFEQNQITVYYEISEEEHGDE